MSAGVMLLFGVVGVISPRAGFALLALAGLFKLAGA